MVLPVTVEDRVERRHREREAGGSSSDGSSRKPVQRTHSRKAGIDRTANRPVTISASPPA
jgi:hypothetical protein